MYGLNTGNGSLKSMYERPETVIAKANVLSLDCTVLWLLTETHQGFRHKNSPIDGFVGCSTFGYDILEGVRYGVKAMHASLRGLVFICKFDK